jgi:nucleotidyltransferase/DNA polymerase involved in DNA repair
LRWVQTKGRDSDVTRLLALVWPTLRAPEGEQAVFDAMLDRLDDLSPRIEAVDRGVALVEITGLGPLLGDERRIAARAVALTREVAPLPVKAGVGDNRWLAVLAARLARPQREGALASFHAIPSREGTTALAPLSLDLLPADPATRARFALFGLTSMGQLATLPRSAVGAQFGEAGERLQQLARGQDHRSLVPRRRPERLMANAAFEPPAEGITEIALALRRLTAELCDALRARHLAPGRATLSLRLEDASKLGVELAFPEPALEPDWIARLLIGRLEQATRARQPTEEEPRIVAIGLAFDRLADPATRQLPAFEARVGRWEELRWSLERLTMRFGEGRLWRAVHDRPSASLAERRARLTEIGPS